MEPHDRPAQALSEEQPSSVRSRLRLLAACAVLVGVAMVQSPGLLVADTKFDLAVAPAEFLARAAHLWDAQGAFGQLQNQAYGYLWPMGPFFLLGSLADVPGWVVQRLWVALVMCVALVGAAKVSRQLGVRSDLACLLAGFAYALSPRMLTTLGPISIEAWPSALAPWVLLPLMVGSARGSARRAAALSALAVAMVGGVNAAATSAVLPLGALWLLTRSPGPRRRTLMLWWPLFTVLGTLWWLIPLFTMGAYSPPFLDFIESATNTTFPTTLFDAFRGTSNWVPYVDLQSRAGNDLIRHSYLVVDSGVVLFLGVAGLLRRSSPHRLFLALGVLTGMLLVTMGHTGGVHGWFAADLQALLDGPLAPLRNVHKFDPVLRLPLVLGLACAVDGVLERRGQHRAEGGPSGHILSVNGYVVTGTAIVAVLGASLPAVAGRITPAGGMTAVPGYWQQAAAWLARTPSTGTSLLVPGSAFGDYVWGSPHDEPLQSLARSPWAVRNAIPLAPPGNIRMLDALEARLAQGAGSPGLATYLRRAGVAHLVVRNDLARSNDVPDPVLVHQALAGSPGVRRVATFGPDVGGRAHIVSRRGDRVVVNGGWQTEYPAVEVYAVEGGRRQAVAARTAPTVVGGPEDLLDLADLGVVGVRGALGALGDQPTVLAADVRGAPPASAPLVLTDGMRAVERNFGRVHDAASATLAPGDPRRLGNPTRDYLMDDRNRWSTTARIEGARRVTASSSMSDADAVDVVQPGQLPYAALDGDSGTAWRANARTDQPAWWQVRFSEPRPVDVVTVTAGADDREVVRIRTSHRTSAPLELEAGARRVVRIGDPNASWLRVEDASGRVGHRLSLAEVSVPGLSVNRSLVLPDVPRGWGDPDEIVLRAVGDGRTGCVEVDDDVRCVSGREVAPEEPAGFRRRFHLAAARDFEAALRVRARPGADLSRLLLENQPVGLSASSVGDPDVRASALAAVDGDPSTTWTAARTDLRPTLRLSWIGQRRVSGLGLAVSDDAPARLPSQVTVIWPGGRRTVQVRDGAVRFPVVRTDTLTIRVDEAEPATSLGFDSVTSPLPVGVGEVRVRGVPFVPIAVPRSPVSYPCGSGPTVVANGTVTRTALTARPTDLYAGREVQARLCGRPVVALEAGENVLDVRASGAFAPTALVLSHGGTAPPPPRSVRVTAAGPAHRTLLPDEPRGLVSVAENANPGWRAVQDGRSLPDVTVDGWQQGWRQSGGAAVLTTFSPDRVYRWGLLAGLLALLSLVVVCAVPRRRWRDAPLDPSQALAVPVAVRVAGAVLVGGLLAGWPGALLAALACGVTRALARRAPGAAPWVLAGLVLPAAAAYAIRPWGGSAEWAGSLEWPHYLVLAACASLLGWPPDPAPGRWRSFRRIPGFSTRR